MHRAEHEVVAVEILSDQLVGCEGGFLAIRRLRLVNLRADGTRSAAYLCDFVVRPKGLDAVVVVPWTRGDRGPRVLVRQGLRIPLHVGRPADLLPVPDARPYLFLREVVAGIVEHDDRGEDGLRSRAALEVAEEAGYFVRPEDVRLLGAGTFPSPGVVPERIWLAAVEIADPAAHAPPAGDGSPMEEGATTEWRGLDEAIAACVRGDIEHAPTELALRRLRDALTPG